MESFCVAKSVRNSKNGPVMSAYDIPKDLKSHIVLIVSTDFIEDEPVNLIEIILTTYQEDHLVVPIVPLKIQRSDTNSLVSDITISKPSLSRGVTDNVDRNRFSVNPTRKSSLSMIKGINVGEGNFIFIVQLPDDYTNVEYFLSATIKSKYQNKKIIISVLHDEYSISPEMMYVNLSKRKAEHSFIYRSLLLGSIKLWDIIVAGDQQSIMFCLCTHSNILQFIKYHSTTKYKIDVIEFTSIFSELVGIIRNLNSITLLAMVGLLFENFPISSGDQEALSCLTNGSWDNIWYLFFNYLKVSNGSISDLLFENTVDNILSLDIKRLFRRCAVELIRIDTTTLFPSYRSCSFGLFTILCRLRIINLETVKYNATTPDMELIDASKALEEIIYQIKAILNPSILASVHSSAKSMFDYVDRVHMSIVNSDRKSAEKDEEVILKVTQLRIVASLLQQRYQNMKPIFKKCIISQLESIDNEYDAIWSAIEQVGIDYEILQQTRLRFMDLKQQRLIRAEEYHDTRDANLFRYFWHLNDFQCYLTIRSLSVDDDDAITPMGYVSHWIGYGGKPSPLSQEKSQELKNKMLPASKFQLRQPQGLVMIGNPATSTTYSQKANDWQNAVFVLDSGSNCIQCVRWSEYAEIMLSTLNSVPIRFGRGICCLESKYLIVSDCNSNSIKIVTLPLSSKNHPQTSQPITGKKNTTISSTEPEVALECEIGGSPSGGYRDGSKPLFNDPTGVAVFRNKVIICDRGNHVLRSFEIIENQVKNVTTIAGRAGQFGNVDGRARTSLLHFPTAITATSEYVYFTEQGSVPCIRRYDGDLVETLYSGSPLRNLCGICIDEVRCVALICDNIAATIWKLDLQTKCIEKAVLLQDMPPSPPHIMSMTQKETFCPSAIMTVAPGSFLFTDTSRNQVFRFFDSIAANEAVENAAAKYHPIVTEAENVIQAIRTYNAALETANECIVVAGKSTRAAKQTILQENYCREVRRFDDFCDDNVHLWTETVIIFIRSAPNFIALSYFFDHQKFSELMDDSPLLTFCRSALAEFISNYNFSEPFAEFDKELIGLANIIRLSSKFFRGQELLCLVLHDDRFRLSINGQLLEVIKVVLDDVKWSLDRNLVADLRRECIRWLHRIVPNDILPPFTSTSSFLSSMELTLSYWTEVITELLITQMENSSTMQTLLWIIQVHLESLLTQFIEGDSYKKIKLSCLIQTLQNLFSICQRGILKSLVAILAKSIVSTIHTVPLTAVLEAMKESAMHPSSNHHCQDYCFVFQQLLFSLLSYHYNAMTEKVTLKLNAFLANRKDKIRVVSHWDLQVEMLSYEPELWAFAVLWSRHQEFQYARTTIESSEQFSQQEKNKQYELDFLVDKISHLLEGLFTTFSSGYLSIDTLRKIIAAEKSLAFAWDTLNCLTKYYKDEGTITSGCSQLISMVENEINNSLSDVQSLLKVVTTLMPSSPLLVDIQYMVNNWSSFIINSIRRLMPVPPSSIRFSPSNEAALLQFEYNYQEKEKQKVMDMIPLPIDLLQALNWLEFCVDKSSLFRLFWNIHSEDIGDENIRFISLQWMELYTSLCNKTIRFETLNNYGVTMLIPKELMLLYRTTSGIMKNNNSNNNDTTNIVEKNLTEDSIIEWTVKPIDNREGIEDLRRMVGQWLHVKQVYFGYQGLLQTFGYSKPFLDSQAHNSLITIEQSLHQLILDVNASGVWDAQDCTLLSQYWQHANLVDIRWLSVNSKLLNAMKANEPLLIWLESIRDDGAFSSSVEVTLGLQEMECPLELWDNHSKRVNEQLMSMLQNVRSYFHRYLYLTKHPIENVSAFLDIFSSMNNAVDCDIVCGNIEVIGNSTDGAAPSRLALLYLPKCNSSWVCSKKSNTINIVMTEADAIVGKQQYQQQQPMDSVYLKYCVEVSSGPRSPGEGSEMSTTTSPVIRVDWRWHGLQDLLDFQSTIVLAQSGMQSDSLQMVMNIFIAQFSWIRKLGEILGHLHESGHFAYYPEFEETVPITTTVASIQLSVSALESELIQWKKSVDAARLQFYFLNFITIKRCRLLLSVLSKVDINDNTINDTKLPGVVPIKVAIAECISFLNVDISFDEKLVSDLTIDFIGMWREKLSKVSIYKRNECDENTSTSHQVIVGVETYSATELLLVLCHCINEVLSKVPIRQRVIDMSIKSDGIQSESEIDMNHEYTKFPPASATESTRKVSNEEFGVFVVHCDSSRECYDSAMSLYASSGILPEWENFMICEQSTPVEVVLNFLRRWHFASLHSRETSNYSLLQVQQLSYATQAEAISLLNELQLLTSNNTKIRNTLVLFSFGKLQCQLTARYAHRKKDIPILSESVLSNIGIQLQNYGGGISCHTSIMASAGKSFAIRVKAYSANMKYVHMPINSLDVNGSNRQLVHRLHNNVFNSYKTDDPADEISSEENNQKLRKVMIHFELTNSIGSAFNKSLFDICIIGILQDFNDELLFTYDPKNTSIAVEMSQSQLLGPLSVGTFFPISYAKATPETFIVDEEILRAGMGADFSSSLYDALATDLLEPRAPTTAFDRLLYVGNVLSTLNNRSGSFPYMFLSSVATAALDGPSVFKQLVTAAGLELNPSLSCLWNFINVVYWQIQEMHHPESPLNSACTPDSSSPLVSLEKDQDSKEKIKGEIINFITRTAREFATRQAKKRIDPNRIVGLQLKGFSRTKFNQLWIRLRFDNDNQPCFQSSCRDYFLYFRSKSGVWVIDDVIEQSGATYSCTENDDLNSTWISSPAWAESRQLNVHEEKGSSNGIDTVTVSGCGRLLPGSSATGKEDGIYHCLPAYDNINGKKHYLKDSFGSNRRHLFFASTRRWQISPVCNEDQGLFIRSTSENLGGLWEYIPPDIREKSKVIVKYRGEDDNTPTTDSESLAKTVENDDFDIALLGWKESNHECILFSNKTHTVTFLSLNPQRLRRDMHPSLVKHLEQNNIVVGEDLLSINKRYCEILSSLTGVKRSQKDAEQLLNGNFCLTGDAMLKILAIVYRECGCGKTMLLAYLCAWLGFKLITLDVHGGTTEQDIIDIFRIAEKELTDQTATGTTPSSIYVFLDEVNTCAYMGIINEALCHRTINGVRLHEGIRIMAALNPYRTRPAQEISSGLTFRRNLNDTADYHIHDAMSQLVYRVHPIPLSIRDHIFDFGALDEDTERVYISSMVRRMIVGIDKESEAEMIGSMIHKSQSYVREQEGDPSVVSLRDVNRCLLLLLWFHEKLGGSEKKEQKAMSSSEKKPSVSARGRATVLALAHVYCYRLPTAIARNSFWVQMSSLVKSWGKEAQKFGFYGIGNAGCPQTIISRLQQRFIRSLEIESGIAMNEALTENIYVTIICILNKIPVFIVGKPGSSKTLAIQIIASNLQGKQSPNPLWRKFPAVYIFQYQCSPLSTSASIKYQFDAACSYQQHSLDVITVLLLDEVGLAETSPDMPLKVLHYMLLDPPIAIVGISNWTLDSSKMNRAICLQRPEPTAEDLMFTGKNIVSQEATESSSTNNAVSLKEPVGVGGSIPRPALVRQMSPTSRMQPWLASLARAFRSVYHDQKAATGSREFIGLRDYYCLLKQLREELSATQDNSGVEYMNSYLNANMLSKAVARNFGGKPDLMPLIHSAFQSACMPHIKSVSDGAELTNGLLTSLQPNAIQLIHDNLASKTARHLMLLTSNDAALHILFGCGIIEVQNVNVLVGSRFKEDLHELHLIHQINEVKHAMARGKTVVLLNHDDIYESLYDVLNLRYVMRTDSETGKTRRMLRLAMGPRSQLCPVEEGFKLIVIVNKYHAYDNLDLPLLNRFEKQVLEPSDLLTECMKKTLLRLELWCDDIRNELGLEQLNSIFCGAYVGTLPSLLLSLLHGINSFHRGGVSECKDNEAVDRQMQTKLESYQQVEYDEDQLLQEAKYQLLRMSFPAPILLSEVLGQALNSSKTFKDRQEYFRNHSDILTLLNSTLSNSSKYNTDQSGSNNLFFVTTKSPVVHFEVALNHFITKNYHDETDVILTKEDMKLLELALMSSENVFVAQLQSFYSNSSPSCPKLLVILCDPLECDLCLVSHTKFLCAQQKVIYDGVRSITATTSVSKHIVFILHLPPGVKHRQREFILDYHQPWIYLYVDDLRISADVTSKQPELFQMLQLSVADIFSLKLFDMRHMLKGCVTTALARCSAPMLPGNHDHINPVQILKDLLQHHSFIAFVESYIMECFQDLALRNNRNGLPLHISIACQDNAVAGTLRQCILMSLESLLTQSVAHIVRQVDRNFSFRWVYSNIDKLELWIGLTSKLIDRATLGNLCPFVAPSFLHEVDSSVINSGIHGILVSEFPCSDRIIQLLRNPETRAKVEGFSQSLKDTEKSLQSVLRSFLGDKLLVEVENISKLSTKYVHDFVAISVHPFQSLSFEKHLYIFLHIIDATDPIGKELGYTPSRIQSCFWMNELRIFHIMSLVNAALLVKNKLECDFYESGKILAESIYKALHEATMATIHENTDNSKIYDDTYYCARFDQHVVTAILSTMSADLTRCLSSDEGTNNPLPALLQWLLFWDAIEGDLQVLLTMLLNNTNVKEDQSLYQSIRCEVLYLWWGIQLAKTIILEWRSSHDDADAAHIDTLKGLIELSITCKPASAQSFMSFANYCKSEMSKWTNFLYSYLSSFVYSEFSYLSKTFFSLEFDIYFVELLGDIVVGKFCRSLGHRKLALTLLIELIKSNDKAKHLAEETMRKSFSSNIMTAQLYLHYLEDSDSHDAKNNNYVITVTDYDSILLLHQAIADDVRFFQLLSTDDFNVFIIIKNIRNRLNKLAVTLSDYLSNKTENKISDIPFPEIVGEMLLTLIAKVPEIHLYLMKILLDISGEDILLKYIYWEHRPFVLPVGVDCHTNQYQESDITIADPFPIVFDQTLYIKGSSAILQTISDSSSGLSAADSFDFFKYCFEGSDIESKNRSLKSALLVAVTSRLLLDPMNIERFQLCREFLLVSYRRLYAVRQSRIDFTLPLLEWLIDESANVLTLDRSALFQHQLMVHIAIMLILEPDNWLASLLRNPIALKSSLLPSFPDSAFYTIMQSFVARERVGWYTCKNGHPYVVGECTLPMELSFCSDCGAKIGGQNHNIVKGAERMSTHELDDVTNKRSVGYDLSVATSEKTYAVERTSVLTAQILRYIINTILLLSINIIPSNLQEVIELLYPLTTKSGSDKDLVMMVAELELLRVKDWEAIRKSTGLGEEDLAMGLHLVFHACSKNCKEGKLVLPGIINDHDTRLLFERSFEVCVESIFATSRCRQTIRDAIAKTRRTKGSVILITCLGKYGVQLFEAKLPSIPQSATTAVALLWRRRMPVTLDVFIRVFQVKKINLTIYPILAVLLEREAELPMVKFIVDILAWHAVLFRVFSAGRLTREEASTIKNSDVIIRLPPSERIQATQVLTTFCKAFNTAFPLVTHLHECNPNPFITRDGSQQVDLSGGASFSSSSSSASTSSSTITGGGKGGCDSNGTGNEMGLHTTINFSLPAIQNGETDAAGLCTIRLLAKLEEINNSVVEALHKASLMRPNDDETDIEKMNSDPTLEPLKTDNRERMQQRKTAVTPALQKLRENIPRKETTINSQELQVNQRQQEQQQAPPSLPATNYLTPLPLLLRRLVVYDRSKHLLPLINAFTEESMSYGEGTLSGFNFFKIEQGLRRNLLPTSSIIVIQVRQYQYAGELRKSDGLLRLKQRVKQEMISKALLDQIWNQIDTQHRLMLVMRQLEDCITFLTSTGLSSSGGGLCLNEDVKLHRYILDTLLVDPDRWNEVSCPALNQLSLKHIQSLYLGLEEKGQSDPLETVAIKYREPLPEEIAAALKAQLTAVDRMVFLGALRELATQQLSIPTWPIDAALKEYLCYSDPELDSYEWFKALPSMMQLRHTYSIYHFCSKNI